MGRLFLLPALCLLSNSFSAHPSTFFIPLLFLHLSIGPYPIFHFHIFFNLPVIAGVCRVKFHRNALIVSLFWWKQRRTVLLIYVSLCGFYLVIFVDVSLKFHRSALIVSWLRWIYDETTDETVKAETKRFFHLNNLVYNRLGTGWRRETFKPYSHKKQVDWAMKSSWLYSKIKFSSFGFRNGYEIIA